VDRRLPCQLVERASETAGQARTVDPVRKDIERFEALILPGVSVAIGVGSAGLALIVGAVAAKLVTGDRGGVTASVVATVVVGLMTVAACLGVHHLVSSLHLPQARSHSDREHV
jgi:hypothetical protein